MVAARVVIKESKDTSKEQRLDLPGLASSGIALFALTYALIEANNKGWTSAEILALFAIAIVGFAVFVLLERHQRNPMLDLSLFRNRTFSGANLTMALVALSMFGVFFYVSLFVQGVLHYSPVKAGAAFLPMTLCIIFFAPVAGKLSDRIGSRWLMGTGMLLVSLSLVLFSLLDASSDFWNLLPALLVGGAGMAMAMTPTTAAAMGSVPVDKAGVGSGVLNSMRQVGGSLGVAISGAILGSYATFVEGFQAALHVSAGIAFAASIVAFVTVRQVSHQRQVAVEMG
jgi:predicted MFS family arabinose efflux permease